MSNKSFGFFITFAVLVLAAGVYFFIRYLPSFSSGTSEQRDSDLVVVVQASCPGANAQVVAETVAAPIETALSGLDTMLHMRSRCNNDGTYILQVTFEQGVDLIEAQEKVQERVAVALPMLPNPVQDAGVTIRRKSLEPLLFVCLFSPDNSCDALYLSNYTTLFLADEFSRLPGIAEVVCLGKSEIRPRVQIDQERMAAIGLTVSDVISALEQQSKQGGLGAKEQFPDMLADIIVKVGPEGRIVRLKDLAVVTSALAVESKSCLNGKPSVVLAVYAIDGQRHELNGALKKKLAELRRRFPQGVDANTSFDLTPKTKAADQQTTPNYLLVDLDLPYGLSKERVFGTLEKCGTLLQGIEGIKDALILSENPFDITRNHPCIVVRLDSEHRSQEKWERLKATARTRLSKITEAKVRLRDLAETVRSSRFAYPLDLALHGPEQESVGKWADKLVQRLGQSQQAIDVSGDRDSVLVSQLFMDIDRAKARQLGVELQTISETLQAIIGSGSGSSFNPAGRTVLVEIQVGDPSRKPMDRLQEIQIRTGNGQLVPLSTIVAMREVQVPSALDRLDGQPMVEITGKPVAGVSVPDACQFCQALAEEVRKELQLPGEYKLTWLQQARK